MSDMDEMLAWLRGVLDQREQEAEFAPTPEGRRSELARVEAERAIIDLEFDPYTVSDIDGQDVASARDGGERRVDTRTQGRRAVR